ncbi:MAG: hypothetical protein HZC54_21235 [Verrucomicrobia bacterium]|nr:hypothetical protein [Verrucomicrobiota bacterium]
MRCIRLLTKTAALCLVAAIAIVAAPAAVAEDGITNTISGVSSNISGDHMVGTNGAFNALILTNAGVLNVTGDGIIGNSAIANSNAVWVTGAGSVWSNSGALYVGFSGSGNSLSIAGSATVAATNVVIGFNSSSGNTIIVSGGSLFATNAASTGAFDVRNGSLNLNSGVVMANHFYATNGADSLVNFSGGLLRSGGGSVSNGVAFAVGDGVQSATLDLLGGTHAFANGLFINTNAFLTGTGAITGSITNAGVIAPGHSAGALNISGSMTLNTPSTLSFEIGGANTNAYDRVFVGGVLRIGGALNVSLVNGYRPLFGDRFGLFHFTAASGAFSAISMPVLDSPLAWNTNLLYSTGEIVVDRLEFVGLGGLLPSGTLGGSYNQTLQAAGGAGSYTWSWSGSTPPGLSLSTGGVLSGTPTTAGAYSFTISVTDGQATASQPVIITIQAPVLAAGYQHTLVLKWNGAVAAWGRNLYGQLGNGTTNASLTAVQASGLTGIIALAAGYDHTLALKPDGTVWAWGWNTHGQLGNGTTNSVTTPVQVSGLSGVIAIAAGAYQSAALKSDGTVWTWGYNSDGELGDGTTVSRSTPVQVSGLSGVVAIASGDWHTLALKSDGTIWAWGLNFYAQLGDGTTTERHAPVQAAGISGVTAIEAGWGHSVALKSDGTVWGWGNNGDGELGDGTTTNRAAPVQVTGLSGVTAIAAGYRHTLGLKADGTVWGWGYNLNGQLGDGTTTNRTTPSQAIGLSGVTALVAGWDHSAALKSDGTVWGWGYNVFGALGDGTTSERATPVLVVGFNTQPNGSLQVTLNPLAAVTAGAQWRVDSNAWQNSGVTVTNLLPGSHTVRFNAITGWNAPTNLNVTVTSLLTTVTNATYTARVDLEFIGLGSLLPSVVLGGSYNRTLQASGGTGPYTWSWTGSTPPGMSLSAGGVLSGTPTTAGAYNFTIHVTDSGSATTNQNVSLTIQNATIAAGYQHTVALKWNGSVRGWGRNLYGQLGNGATNTVLTVAEPVGLGNAIALAAGYDHTLALKSNGTVWAWGWNAHGQLGNGTTTSATTPVQVSGLSGVTAIAAGAYQSAALKSDGTVWMWGYNNDGELGDGTAVSRSTPVQVSGLSGVVAIAGGLWHTLALKSDGTIWAWGLNFYAQLGDGTTTGRNTPVQAAGVSGVTAIAAGWGHSLALKSDGTVWGWGYNADGELGDGTTINRATPVQVSGLSGVTAIAAGYRHTLGLKADGTVWGWGFNLNGQLGNGTIANRSTPSQVSGLGGVTAITAGWDHNAALKPDGTVWGWGQNVFGALGDGTTAERITPAQAVGFNALPDGSLQVILNPAGAISAGARWSVDGTVWRNSGVMLTNLLSGSHTLSFSAATGWIAPTNLNVTITGFQTTATNVTYLTPEFGRSEMLAPASNAVLNATSVTFNWSRGTSADQYALWLGSAAAGYDMAALLVGTNLSQTLTVPATGAAIYMRLWSQIFGAWYYHDYTYTAPVAVKAALLSPASGTTNTGSSVTFAWNAGVGASQYALWVGSASNTYDLHALAVGTNLSRTLTLPVDGRAIYTRLWSLISGTWQYNDYSCRAFNAVKARFTGLGNGATLGSANVTLTWDAGAGASQYALWVGSTPGSHDLAAMLTGTNLSQALTLPADGRRLYVRLWSLINGTWKQNDYEFAAYTDPASLAARMLSPTNGTTLLSTPVAFNWSSGTGASQYALWVGSVAGDYDLHALLVGTNRTQALSVPLDGGAVHVRLWSLVGGTWQFNDYAYGTSVGGAAVKAQMTSPVNGATLAGASTLLSWNAGTGASQYALWAGSTPGSYDLYAAVVGTNRTQTVTLPVDGGPVYVRLWSLMSGVWKFNDYFYTAFLAP